MTRRQIRKLEREQRRRYRRERREERKLERGIERLNRRPPKRLKVDIEGRNVKLKRKRAKALKARLHFSPGQIVFLVIAGLALIVYFVLNGRWSFVRLGHSLWALLIAVIEYLLSLCFIDTDFLPVPLDAIPDVPFVPLLPLDSSELSGFFKRFGDAFISAENFAAYNVGLSNVVQIGGRLLLPFFLLWIFMSMLLAESAEVENDDFCKKSPGVKRLERIGTKVRYVRDWLLDLWYRLPFWLVFWGAVFILAGTNVLTIAVSALAALFHMSVSFDVVSIWIQIYKLALDLTVMFSTLPWWVWVAIFYELLRLIRRSVAYEKLQAMERKIRAFIKRLPLCVLITGKIGAGKTSMNANLTLSCQDGMRDRMKQTMTEIQAEFPEYPWPCFDQQIGIMYFCGDLPGKERTREIFRAALDADDDLLYGYTGRRTFSDGVLIYHLKDRLVDYAVIQWMYRVQCIVSSSYSLRVDGTYIDKGKLPHWQTDYFRSPPFDPHGPATRAKILDFETLRLGKTMTDTVGGAWEFGVLSHTEMGKDFGNALTNKDIKASDPRANIRNDMIIDRVKILRHSSTACFTPYAQYFGDEQRPTSLMADMLDLCDVLRIDGTSEDRSVYPYLTVEAFFSQLVMSIFAGWFQRRRINRADTDVFTWVLSKLMDVVYPRYRRKVQLFGYQMCDASLFNGAELDGEPEKVQIPVPFKKVRADRYATDCFQGVLSERAKASMWEYDLAPVYAGSVATPEEIRAGHSYFGNKMLKIGGEDYDRY